MPAKLKIPMPRGTVDAKTVWLTFPFYYESEPNNPDETPGQTHSVERQKHEAPPRSTSGVGAQAALQRHLVVSVIQKNFAISRKKP
jgi:hypothetical protein